uniref:Uncharacterized protein n=1 Tax=Salix viminalis TaxID=40686 RepID=A0A6N2N5Q7_SALVM
MFTHKTHLILGHTNRRRYRSRYFTRLGGVIESILSHCLGLPPTFLEEFNHDRRWDFMATETENSGITEHEE